MVQTLMVPQETEGAFGIPVLFEYKIHTGMTGFLVVTRMKEASLTIIYLLVSVLTLFAQTMQHDLPFVLRCRSLLKWVTSSISLYVATSLAETETEIETEIATGIMNLETKKAMNACVVYVLELLCPSILIVFPALGHVRPRPRPSGASSDTSTLNSLSTGARLCASSFWIRPGYQFWFFGAAWDEGGKR